MPVPILRNLQGRRIFTRKYAKLNKDDWRFVLSLKRAERDAQEDLHKGEEIRMIAKRKVEEDETMARAKAAVWKADNDMKNAGRSLPRLGKKKAQGVEAAMELGLRFENLNIGEK